MNIFCAVGTVFILFFFFLNFAALVPSTFCCDDANFPLLGLIKDYLIYILFSRTLIFNNYQLKRSLKQYGHSWYSGFSLASNNMLN